MLGWQIATVIGVALGVVTVALVALRRCYDASKQHSRVTQAAPLTRPPPLSTTSTSRAVAETLESLRISGLDPKPKQNFNLFRRGQSTRPLFSWADHPSLIADAFENGWSRFAFINYSSTSASSRSSLLGLGLGLGLVGDHNHNHQGNGRGDTQLEMSWEVGDGSDDFMQKIRMNSGLKRIGYTSSSSVAARSSIRTALPLPGPSVGNSFPQEAYFEIKIISVEYLHEGNEGEKVKLIEESNSNGNCNSDLKMSRSLGLGLGLGLEELKFGSNGGDKGASASSSSSSVVMVSVGLTTTFTPQKLPGTYRGSIGFNSNGSVNLDGMKLVFESEKLDWGQEERTIGCGFDPSKKRVFFTVDSELVHVINCKSEEFGSPLYPLVSANADVTVLVNLGQCRFSYEPANATRTPNPCFIIGSHRDNNINNYSPAGSAGYEDSGELFSIGRIEPAWVSLCMPNNKTNTTNGDHTTNSKLENGSRSKELDEDDSEADLFEIVLDTNNNKTAAAASSSSPNKG